MAKQLLQFSVTTRLRTEMLSILFILSLLVLVSNASAGLSTWTGTVIDSSSNGLSGIPVTLHVMGFNPDYSAYEISSIVTQSAGKPYPGHFTFNFFDIPNSAFVYTDAQASGKNGVSNNYTIQIGRTGTGSIVITSLSNPINFNVFGYVTDSNGLPYSGIPVTVHVIGFNPDYSTYEIYSVSKNSGSTPFEGSYQFNDLIVTNDAAFFYVSANASYGGGTISGMSNNYTIFRGRTSQAPIVMPIIPDTSDTASWTGSLVDTMNNGIGGVPVTLHVMSVYPNETVYQLRTYTSYTSNQAPFKGLFTFSNVDLDGVAAFGYVDTITWLGGNGASFNYTMQRGRTTIGSIVDIGRTDIGVFRNSMHMFYLDSNGNGAWNGAVTDRQYNFGISGDIPVTGDWDNNGAAEIGVFRNSTHLFYLDYNGNGAWNGAVTDKSYNFGISGDIPLSADWNDDGKSEIGVFRSSTHVFYLDYNANGAWNGASVDRQYNFGITGDKPITGSWS